MATGTIKTRLVREIITLTTGSSGGATLGIPFSKIISIALSTTGQNWYVLYRQAGDGRCAVLLFDKEFSLKTDTTFSIQVVHE